ncbi:MAG: alpha/beta hydrolase [Eubacteriaceae bacterium]|jgi:pimeloyl-ACP methyl ester carboxylesterase|nr:alpha/beta hydrolase [Eubacteriaceae bacterium]
MFHEAGGIKLFYEKTGEGRPILLLHGNGEDHHVFDILSEQLSPSFSCYALDSRAHGQSQGANVLHYMDMMEDVASFALRAGLRRPALYGFSDGGIVGLLLAIHYPDMLSALAISGANITPDGVKPSLKWMMRRQWKKSKDPKLAMMLFEPHISLASLSSIRVPTLVLAGSKDIIPQAHTKVIARHLPNSELRILPGEGHGSYVVHSPKLYSHIIKFLQTHP